MLFKFNGLDTLFAKVFNEDGARKGCCEDRTSCEDDDSDDEEGDSSGADDHSSSQRNGAHSLSGSA